MCELFGFSSAAAENIAPQLQTFFSHSIRHPHGWGLALLEDGKIHVEKEPVRAIDSLYLKRLLEAPVRTSIALGHIRYATIGNVAWRNCHPYTARDLSGRHWALIHNGTIFDYPPLDRFYASSDSDTDSACILALIIENINTAYRAQGQPLTANQRFTLLDEILVKLSPHNKVNLIIFDGELLYVHTNYRDSLWQCKTASGVLLSTQPLTEDVWTPVPFTTLLAYRDGALAFTGTNHGFEYEENPAQMKLLYLAYSGL